MPGGRRLHLLEVGVRWPPETFVRAKLERLAAAGMRVTVASPVVRDEARPELPGLELLELTHSDAHPARKVAGVVVHGTALALRHPRRAIALARALRGPLARARPGAVRKMVALLWLYLPLAAQRPDVVQFEWETAAVHYLPLAEVWGCPVVMACRGGDISVLPHVPGATWAERMRKAMRRVAAVHCVSEATRGEAAAFGLDRARAHVVRTAVDPVFFAPNGGPPRNASELRVVSIGTLRWRKCHEAALEVVAELRRRSIPVRLEILGGDPGAETGEESQRERLLYTAADLELGASVSIDGDVGPDGVRDRLRGAHALLHTGLAEGIPNAVVEGMSCGVPVVAADCGGVREAVTDGVEGFVVPPRDVGAMAGALERLWRDAGLRERMGRAGRARATAEFSPERQVEAFLSLYRSVA